VFANIFLDNYKIFSHTPLSLWFIKIFCE